MPILLCSCHALPLLLLQVNDLIDKVLTGQVATSSSSSSPSTTAIAAGVAVAGGVLLAALLGFLLWRRKRLQQSRQKLPLYKQPSVHSAGSAVGKDASEQGPRYDLAVGQTCREHAL